MNSFYIHVTFRYIAIMYGKKMASLLKKAAQQQQDAKLKRIAITGDFRDSDIMFADAMGQSELDKVQEKYKNMLRKATTNQLQKAVACQQRLGACRGPTGYNNKEVRETFDNAEKEKITKMIEGKYGTEFREQACDTLRVCASMFPSIALQNRF